MSEERLHRAMAGLGAPARDPGFVYDVMARAEALRYRRRMTLALLRGAGLAAALAALALPALGWAANHGEALQDGLLLAVGLVTLVSAARLFRPALAIFLAR